MQWLCIFVKKKSISRNDIFSKVLKPTFSVGFFLYPSYLQFLQTLFPNYLELLLQHGKRKNGINRINFVT